LVSLLTFGEGYHNYHHTYQSDYRNGPRWYNFDPSKWLIFTLSLLGLAWSLRTASAAEGKALNS
jgi:stearoyl-CoA desaturase (delta-9 desaturase)